MGARGTFYGGVVLDGLVFHVDAGKQESYAKTGIRYDQVGNSKPFLDFADTSKSPSPLNSTGSIINGATFSNFAPYHLSDYLTPYWHDPTTSGGRKPWMDSAGTGTFYGNIEFDGINDYINFGLTPEMNGITDITVSAWIYINKFKSGAVASGGTVSIIAARYSEISAGNGWELYYDNQGIVYFGGRESGAAYLYTNSASASVKPSNNLGLTANGGWYNVVGTKRGNVWNVYVAEPNKYIKYNLVYQDPSIYTYPYKQALLGTSSVGNGTTVFTTNNLYVGCVSFGGVQSLHMDGRLMSLSVYNRALSLNEINQNYDSFSKRIVKTAFDRGLNNNNVLITYNALDNFGGIANAAEGISARETSLGKNVTVIAGYSNLPNDLSVFSHIWDIDVFTGNLVSLNSSKYTTYLQGGGALFLLGENRNSVFTARNNSLAAFISSVGGGSISFDPSFPDDDTTCSINTQFLLDNSNSSVVFPAIGRFSSIGTGMDIVKTSQIMGSFEDGFYSPGTGGLAVVWKTGTLTNAPKGAIVSVLDVNIWGPDYATAPYYGSDFIKNISLILDRF